MSMPMAFHISACIHVDGGISDDDDISDGIDDEDDISDAISVRTIDLSNYHYLSYTVQSF